ncbi:hypothetical protein [Haloarcula salina]|uniref:Uncharacterized protein n=1 Tax=Haloarcula salina TaxID=1429914 RepID=A0AA41G234_9EURY|nr:hypothetical protein [Haloarcula salina]MBV0902790.1 hypothetical protein [Haloarcula salina]
MATIRVRDWTKEQIERIRDAESHSSHDSVIKSLLKDRKLAQYVDEPAESGRDQTTEAEAENAAPDKPFEDLTVLTELRQPENGVVFLWCPSCGNELAHLTVETPLGVSVFETECQRCLTHLDSHAVVAIEIGYPIEQKLMDDDLQSDLKECVLDYWDRTLDARRDDDDGPTEDATDIDRLVWQFDQYRRDFSWDWPADRPVVGLDAGTTYRDTRTDERVRVLEPVTDNRNALDAFEVRRYPADTDPEAADPDTELLDPTDIVRLVRDRRLILDDPSPSADREPPEPSA